MRLMDLAIIIVTWNVRELVLDALRTLQADLAQSALDARIVVVDSASSDGTVAAVTAHFPDVTMIASEQNLGFGGCNNLGMQHLGFGGDAVLEDLPRAVYLLNPDTLTQLGATQRLYETLMSEPQNGLVGAQLSYVDSSFQHSAFTFPGLRQIWAEFFPTPGRMIEGRFNGRYPRALYEGQTPFMVDFMLGATMLLRREVIVEVGMFDPDFFMYGEEVDWQWRINKAGWRILCEPRAHVVHLSGQSTQQVKPRSVLNLWQSRLRLFEKHYPAWKLWLARRLVALGMDQKIRQGRVTQEDSAVLDAYQTIRKLAQQT